MSGSGMGNKSFLTEPVMPQLFPLGTPVGLSFHNEWGRIVRERFEVTGAFLDAVFQALLVRIGGFWRSICRVHPCAELVAEMMSLPLSTSKFSLSCTSSAWTRIDVDTTLRRRIRRSDYLYTGSLAIYLELVEQK